MKITPICKNSNCHYLLFLILISFISYHKANAQVSTQGLITHYRLNGNGQDAVQGLHASIIGGSFVQDRFGNQGAAFRRSGLGEKILAPSSVNYKNLYNLSISFWFKTSSTNSLKFVQKGKKFNTSWPTDTFQTFRVMLEQEFAGQPHTPAFDVSAPEEMPEHSGLGCNVGLAGGLNFSDGQWHFFTGTSESSKIKIYIDGINYCEFPFDPSIYYFRLNNNDSPIEIALGPRILEMDDIKFYKRILTQAEVTTAFQEPNSVQVLEPKFFTDSTFGTNGKVYNSVGTTAIYPKRLFKQPDGKYMSCAYEYNINDNAFYINMWNVDACGKVDSSFGNHGFVKFTFDQRNSGEDFLIQSDGKIVVVGSQAPNNWSSLQKPYIARFHANGTPDSSFGTFGSTRIPDSPFSSFSSVLALPGGKLMALSSRLFMKFNADGSPDATFGNNGTFQLPLPPGVISTDDGFGHQVNDSTIWTVSANRLTGFDFKVGVYSVNMAGKPDSTFGLNGAFMESIASVNFAVALNSIIQSNGKLVVATTQDDQGVRLVRIMRPGKVDSTFGVNGFVFIPGFRLEKINLLSNDRILVGYSEPNLLGTSFKLLNSNGAIQPDFSINGAVNLVMQPQSSASLGPVYEETNGELVFTGGFNNLNMVRVVPKSISSSPHISRNGNTLNAQVNNPLATFQWIFNGTPITGATAETLEIASVGIYKVLATSEKGCLGIDSIVVTVLAVSGVIPQTGWSLYPNPSESGFRIEGAEGIIRVSRIDLHGRESDCSVLEDQRIDASAWQPGIYQIKMQTQNGFGVKAFWKK